MFCSQCGGPVEEGKAFCKHCGAPVAARSASPTSPQPSTGRTALVIGIVIAVIVVFGGAGTAALLLLRAGGDEASTVTITDGSTMGPVDTLTRSTTSTGPDSTSIGQDGATATSQTIPDLGTSATGGSVRDQSAEDYVSASDEMVDLLFKLDQRIPELAQRINETAPNVPRQVWSELHEMMGQLDAGFTGMGRVGVPRGFEESDEILSEAVMAMGNRVDATIRGIEAMWDTGKIAAASQYFDLGRQARDEYRQYMTMYQEMVPID